MAAERCGRDVWEPRVRAYRNSGMTQKQWCAENDIKVRALAYWIKKLRNEETECDSPEWLRINAQDTSSIAAIDLCAYDSGSDYQPLEFRVQCNHISVYIPCQADDASILRMLRLLEAL